MITSNRVYLQPRVFFLTVFWPLDGKKLSQCAFVDDFYNVSTIVNRGTSRLSLPRFFNQTKDKFKVYFYFYGAVKTIQAGDNVIKLFRRNLSSYPRTSSRFWQDCGVNYGEKKFEISANVANS